MQSRVEHAAGLAHRIGDCARRLAYRTDVEIGSEVAGAGNFRADFNIRAVRQPPRAIADPVGQPRGVLDSRLHIAGYPFDDAIAPDGAAWLTRLHRSEDSRRG